MSKIETKTVNKSIFAEESENKPHSNQFLALLYWDDPIVSFMLFLCIELFCYLVGIQEYPVVSLISALTTVQLMVCLIYVNGIQWWLQFQGKAVPTDQFYSPNSDFITQQQLQELVPTVNALVSWIIDIFRCVDTSRSVTILMVCIVLTIIGQYISFITFLAIATAVGFTCPLLYAKNKVAIDKTITQLINKVKKQKSE